MGNDRSDEEYAKQQAFKKQNDRDDEEYAKQQEYKKQNDRSDEEYAKQQAYKKQNDREIIELSKEEGDSCVPSNGKKKHICQKCNSAEEAAAHSRKRDAFSASGRNIVFGAGDYTWEKVTEEDAAKMLGQKRGEDLCSMTSPVQTWECFKSHRSQWSCERMGMCTGIFTYEYPGYLFYQDIVCV